MTARMRRLSATDVAIGADAPAHELDCLRHVLAPDLLARAEATARAVGVGADQVLIRQGVIGEDAYVAYLAASTGLRLEHFAELGRNDIALADDQIELAARSGMVRIRRDGQTICVLAPRGWTARATMPLAARYPGLRLALTTESRLQEFLARAANEMLSQRAANGLRNAHPDLSAAGGIDSGPIRRTARTAGALTVAAAATLLFVETMRDIAGALLAIWFIAFTTLRLGAGLMPRTPSATASRRRDDRLPVYTVIVALYREASSVPMLMQSLAALDYPREKLDIIFAVELDDLGTRAAVARLGPLPHVRTIIAPDVGPKTKPKALNTALPFARGSLIAVFDAEDRPEPMQLRQAVDAFAAHGAKVACVQASLAIENSSDSWLSRMFAVEYAGQFDVFLPGLAALGMPLPLGGSSNHFRADVLREVGGWDAYNVTEDADLGFRLARHGYRAMTFDSTTLEEAPIRFVPWLKQRSRWMKGWMQTWAVHMRSPLRLRREAGWRGLIALNVLVGGNVLTALAYPILVGSMLWLPVSMWLGGEAHGFTATALAPLHIVAAAAGVASTIIVGLMGLARRERLRIGTVLLWTPIYWGCLSIAAWRALWQFLRDPYRWEKTEHGLTRERAPVPSPVGAIRRSRATRRAQR